MSFRILAWGPLKYVYTEQLHTRGPRLGPKRAREKIFKKKNVQSCQKLRKTNYSTIFL